MRILWFFCCYFAVCNASFSSGPLKFLFLTWGRAAALGSTQMWFSPFFFFPFLHCGPDQMLGFSKPSYTCPFCSSWGNKWVCLGGIRLSDAGRRSLCVVNFYCTWGFFSRIWIISAHYLFFCQDVSSLSGTSGLHMLGDFPTPHRLSKFCSLAFWAFFAGFLFCLVSFYFALSSSFVFAVSKMLLSPDWHPSVPDAVLLSDLVLFAPSRLLFMYLLKFSVYAFTSGLKSLDMGFARVITMRIFCFYCLFYSWFA